MGDRNGPGEGEPEEDQEEAPHMGDDLQYTTREWVGEQVHTHELNSRRQATTTTRP